MDFSIIIPAYQAAAVLPQCLNALCHQSIDRSRYEIIVVDDGSTDNTADVAEQALRDQSPAHVIHAAQVIRAAHRGPAHARNLGVQAAQSNLVLFTDADCEPGPDWIEQLSSVFTDPTISGAKGIYRTRQTSLIARFVQQEYEERYDRLQRLTPIDFVDTHAAAYRRAVFIDQGGFDAIGLPTAAVEDQEFSFRLAARGHRLVFVPEAVVYHQHNTSLRSYFRRKYNIGCWKIYILRRHPAKALRDSHTPQMIKVQIALLAAALSISLAALLLPIGPGGPIGLWAAFFLSMGPLLIKIAQRDPAVLLVAPLMIGVRTLALGLGMFNGLLRFDVFRRTPPQRRIDPALKMKTWLAFITVSAAALVLYLSTAAPSLTWAHAGADGGDLISAAITNGVAHPPGYPTYVTIGQLVARLPIGDAAYRFTLLSAVSMALAVGFTTLSILALSRRALIAILAGLFFAAAPMVWGQATITEVYALNAAFVAAIVYLVTPIVFRREPVSLFRLAFAAWLWGLAFGNSVTVAALAPLTIVVWWRARTSTSSRRVARRMTWLPLLACAIGLSVYLVIPLRALQQPPINWGNATTPDRFFALVSGEMYRGYALSTAPQELLTRIVAFAQLLVMQYGWLGVALATIGMYHALITPNQNWRWLALTILLYLLFALSYNTPDSAIYLIPVWMFGAWAIARGTLSIILWASDNLRRVPSWALLLLIFLVGPLLNVITHYPAMNLRGDHAAVDFANQVLTTAPPGAIVITGSDGHTFALWYHRMAARSRPDLAIVDRRLAGYEWYAAMLQTQGSAPQLPEYDPPDSWLARLATLNPGRALCIVAETTAQFTCD